MKWIYDTVYYSSATLFAFFTFRNEKWFPSELGGTDFKETLYDFPNIPDVQLYVSILLESLGSCILYGLSIKSCTCFIVTNGLWYKDRTEVLGIFITSFTCC